MMGLSKNLDPIKLGQKLEAWLEKRAGEIWSNLLKNHLWQRMLKNTLATTIAVIIAMLPAVVRVYGKAAYLAPITTVFGHPGRRFGMMAEALILAVSGALLGIGWSMFGLYLSSLVYGANAPAAYTIRGLFLAIALLFHGFLRSHTPRLFLFVLLLIIVSVVSLTSTATFVTKISATQLLYPILTAVGLLLLINLFIFPEFSSSFLGVTTIETLGEAVGALRDAGKYFVAIVEEPVNEGEEMKTEAGTDKPSEPSTAAEESKEKTTADATPSLLHRALHFLKTFKKTDEKTKPDETPKTVKLKSLTDQKAKLRAKLDSCKAAQEECNFELAWAVLPPRDLKPISDTHMKKLVANTIALIGACESKYALMGDDDDKSEAEGKDEHQLKGVAEAANAESGEDSSRPGTGVDDSHDESTDENKDAKKDKKGKKKKNRSKTRLEREIEDLELVKPKKEIASGDVELLKYLVSHVAKPICDLQEKIDRSVDVVTCCLAYCYDVPKLPSGARPPKGIQLQEVDIRVDILKAALVDFDRDSASALETAAQLHGLDHPQVDIMPRMETFLISSFLLNLRQAALHTLEMLNHSREIVEKRQARHNRRRLYAPRINWRKWLTSGGEADMLALPANARKEARTGTMRPDIGDDNASTSSRETLMTKKDVESAPSKGSRSQSPQPAIHANQAAKRHKHKPKKGSFVHRLRNRLADVSPQFPIIRRVD
jgi:hypothetical protein